MASRLAGIDVSHYQGQVNWATVKAAGVAFAFAKATDGLTHPDAFFSANWSGIKNAGLVRGAYHFFRPAQDAAAQAQTFLQAVALQSGDLPPVLDVENADGVSNNVLQSGVQTWLETVRAQTGVTPIVYASPGFWNQHMNSNFGSYPLWVAQYGVQTPKIPNGWTDWKFWQYSQSGHVNGVNGAVDLDYFQGTTDDLAAFVGGAPQRATPAAANNLQNPNIISVGQVLQIPLASSQSSAG